MAAVILLSFIGGCDDGTATSYRGIMLIDNGVYVYPGSDVAYNGDNITMTMSTKNAGTITGMQYKTDYMAWTDATASGDDFTCTILPAGYNNAIGWVTVSFRAQNDAGEEFTLEKNAPVYATTAEIEGAGGWLDLSLQDLKSDTGATFTFTLDDDTNDFDPADPYSYQAVVVTGDEVDTIHVRTKNEQDPPGLQDHTHFIDPVTSQLELRGALEAEWFGDGISADSE